MCAVVLSSDSELTLLSEFPRIESPLLMAIIPECLCICRANAQVLILK
jgi:hypothetical protein